jgi:hypothetical protein
MVFWTETSDETGGGVWAESASGNQAFSVYDAIDVEPNTHDLAVATDAFGHTHAFYASNPAPPNVAQLYEVHYSSFFWVRTPLLPQLNPSTMHPYWPRSAVVDASNVYFIGEDEGALGTLYRVPRSGGTPTALASGVGNGTAFGPLATDGASVFYLKGGAIMRIPVGGGAETTFAPAVDFVADMTVHEGALYWACYSCGTIVKQPIDQGPAVILASNQASPSCIAVDDSFVYWGTDSALMKYPN